jgi:hypothetical protein
MVTLLQGANGRFGVFAVQGGYQAYIGKTAALEQVPPIRETCGFGETVGGGEGLSALLVGLCDADRTNPLRPASDPLSVDFVAPNAGAEDHDGEGS